MDGSLDPLTSYDDAPQFGPTRDALPDGLTDAEWLAGAGRKGIAPDDPRRFGPADGCSITERIKARNARLNTWRCAYHVSPGHPDRWQRKGAKRPAKAPRRTVDAPETTPLVVRAGESREAYCARLLALWDSQCAPQGTATPVDDTPTVEIPQADVIAFIEANDGNEVSRAMARAWEQSE